LKGLRHGPATQSAALLRGLIGEDSKMDGSVFETLKLQSRILRTLFAIIAFACALVGADKTAFHRLTTGARLDEHEPPRLAVSN